MKAIILARVSTEEQKEAGNSLPAQIARIENYCKNKGFIIDRVFSFDESAYKTKRDEFDRTLEYLNGSDEKKAICFDKVDRFSRNIFDKRVARLYELVMNNEVELHFVSDNLIITPNISATEKFHFGINLGLAKYYSDAISDSVKRVFEQKRRNGEWTGKAKLGYKNVTLENGKKDLVLDRERATLVLKCFELYSTGRYSLDQIVNIMRKEGFTNIKPPYKPVTKSQIDVLLKDPFYYGEMTGKNGTYPHKYEPIVSKWLFDKCAEIRKPRTLTHPKYASIPFAFRGLKCGYCGCTVCTERKKDKYNYLMCNQYKGPCGAVRVKEEELLIQVKEVIASIRVPDDIMEDLKKDLKKNFDNEQKYYKGSKDRILAGIERIDNRIKIAYADRLDGRITAEEYDNFVVSEKQKQKELNEQYAGHIQADEEFLLGSNYLLELANRALELFKSSEPQQKNELINFLLQNPQLEGKKLKFNLKPPFDVLVGANKSSNWLRRSDSNRQPYP